MPLSLLGFLGIICLLSDFWLHHLGCEATAEKIWYLSAWLCRKTCSCSWTSSCIIKTLACWLFPGCCFVSERWQSSAGDEQRFGQAPSAADGTWRTARHDGFPCLQRGANLWPQFKSDRRVTELVSSQESWSCKSVFCSWDLRGIELAQKSWGLQAWNETRLPCGFFSFKYRHH